MITFKQICKNVKDIVETRPANRTLDLKSFIFFKDVIG